MVRPRIVRRSGKDAYLGYAWNAMIDLCAMERIDALTPLQRKAALAFWYMSEVNNGGHFQYFVNKSAFPHEEVAKALEDIGATHSASVLRSALEHLGARRPMFPDTVDEYLQSEQQFDLSSFDAAWGSAGDVEINRCLQAVLDAHESEFIQWIE